MATTDESADATTHRFEAEVTQVLRLVIDSLYSNKEVFLRELLSNASDALDKRRFRALTEPALLPDGTTLRVRLRPSPEAGTLEIADNGVGMTRGELVEHLGTIAKSGSKAFLEQVRAQGGTADLTLIGQFGVGFYSAFLVADRVDVVTRAAGTDDPAAAHRWSSTGEQDYTIAPAERDEPGTSVVLHLRAEHRGFLEEHRLRELVARYSDYLGYPVEHVSPDDPEAEPATLNQGKALWQKPPSEVSDDQYREFYKHVTHDWEDPRAWKHFKVEGTQQFAGVVFVPKRAPFDMFLPDQTHGIRLHVRRVFVMDDCDELLPRWLRFVRGVVDSEDLPLNVSRETLQDSGVVRTIRKQVTKQVLAVLSDLADNEPEAYDAFWRTFGAVLKEGLTFEPERKGALLPLLRFQSSTSEGKLVSLSEALGNRKEGQEAIYYALGESVRQVETSPHLEALRKRGWEVLYLTDPVDAWAAQALDEVDGVKILDAASAELPVEAGAEDADPDRVEEERKAQEDALSGVLARIRVVLQDHVAEARVSPRLTDSPACLVVPPGGLQPFLERMLRNAQQDIPEQKRILEVNPDHPVIERLRALHGEDPDRHGAEIDDTIRLLHDQSLILEGTPLPDPAGFVRRLNDRLSR
ncbi:MAG TPA: molecular chaperone HtpG [Polyangiaceae bacterium LLY-WYZ-14_1]|nr:molecular chaperone HtpG [Polyangiaceae bacterium LLY-WYZ-14_1]